MVERMTGMGMMHRQIARILKIDRSTLEKHFREELDIGHIKANMVVTGHLFAMTKNNVRAAEFWLINRDPERWQNRQVFDQRIKVTDERPNFSALSTEELAVLRQAAALLRRAAGPKQIEGHATRVAGPTQGQDNEEGAEAE